MRLRWGYGSKNIKALMQFLNVIFVYRKVNGREDFAVVFNGIETTMLLGFTEGNMIGLNG